jgi:hypothetical protein
MPNLGMREGTQDKGFRFEKFSGGRKRGRMGGRISYNEMKDPVIQAL